MADKEQIDYLLLDIQELEKLIIGMRNAEMYPVSFFSKSFDLTHKVLQQLHTLEALQIEFLRKQMEEHQAILNEIPHRTTIVKAVQVDVKTEEKEAIPEILVIPSTEQDKCVSPISENMDITTDKVQLVDNTIIPVQVEKENVTPQPELQPDILTISTSAISEEKIPAITLEKTEKNTQAATHTSSHTAESMIDKIQMQHVSFNAVLEKKHFSDFKKAFSLNDRFYFRRELFVGDEALMNQTIAELNEIHSYEESLNYLDKVLKWNMEDRAVGEFVKLIEKRFS